MQVSLKYIFVTAYRQILDKHNNNLYVIIGSAK